MTDCASCGYKLQPGMMKCAECGAWNRPEADAKASVMLADVKTDDIHRIPTGPWDDVFGGGLVCTSCVLLAGGPGAGKSTLGLQIADEIVEILDEEVIYVHAEQIAGEMKLTADRLGIRNMNKIRLRPKLTLGEMMAAFLPHTPAAVIVDSVVALTAGDQQEAVDTCIELKKCAVGLYAPIIVIDHVAKKEDFAGLKRLEHEVDALFSLRVDKRSGLRILKAHKNRFGPAPIEVILEMTEQGLREFAAPESDDKTVATIGDSDNKPKPKRKRSKKPRS